MERIFAKMTNENSYSSKLSFLNLEVILKSVDRDLFKNALKYIVAYQGGDFFPGEKTPFCKNVRTCSVLTDFTHLFVRTYVLFTVFFPTLLPNYILNSLLIKLFF